MLGTLSHFFCHYRNLFSPMQKNTDDFDCSLSIQHSQRIFGTGVAEKRNDNRRNSCKTKVFENTVFLDACHICITRTCCTTDKNNMTRESLRSSNRCLIALNCIHVVKRTVDTQVAPTKLNSSEGPNDTTIVDCVTKTVPW